MLFRCVLAASSPVLASILSSAGALVELQAPCLSDSVLAHVLDYIYTGALPCTQSHQQFSSLFSAACYLKMDELQRTLETRANRLQLSGSCAGASPERAGTTTTGCSKAERSLQGVNTGRRISISSSETLPNVQRYQFHPARPADPESWLQMQVSSAEEGESGIVEATQQLCLTPAPGPEEEQARRREEQICYLPCCVDGGSCTTSPSPSPSPPSPHPSCGAVPVIRHSSAATAAEACAGPLYQPRPQVSGSNGAVFEDVSSAHDRTQSFDGRSHSDKRAGHDPQRGTDTHKLPSVNVKGERTEDPAFVQRERGKAADSNHDGDESQPLASSTPTYSVVEQSYHAHLHYHCLHQEEALLSHGTSDLNPSPADPSDRASDEDEGGPFSSAAQRCTPADQVLLLDISTKPPELLISYRYDERGGWAPLGRGVSGGRGDGDAAETVAEDGDTDVKSSDEPSEAPGDQVKGRDDGESYTPSCAPFCVPGSPHAPASPTSTFCIPSAISVDMPTIVSPQLSHHHPFQCTMCRRSFSQRGSLNRHMRSHLGIRPFPCPRCPMTFSRQYRVSEHMRVHQRCVLGSDFQKPPASST